MEDELTDRVETLERAVTDGEYDLSALSEDAQAMNRLAELETKIDEIEEQIGELEAATQALRGYVGNVRSVNEEVENRAETALQKVERLEDDLRERTDTGHNPTTASASHDSLATDERSGPETTLQASDEPDPSSHPPGTLREDRQESPGRSGVQSEQQPDRSAPAENGVHSVSTDRSQTNRQGPQQSQPRSNSCDSGAGDVEGGGHCHACGQQKSTGTTQPQQSGRQARTQGQDTTDPQSPVREKSPVNHSDQPSDTRQSKPEHTQSSQPEAGRQFDSLREDDPLVSDAGEDNQGTLARFRNLL